MPPRWRQEPRRCAAGTDCHRRDLVPDMGRKMGGTSHDHHVVRTRSWPPLALYRQERHICLYMMRLGHAVRTMFADLAQKVEDAPRPGSIYTRRRDGIEYLYAKVRVGAVRVDRFLGRVDNEEAQRRAAEYRLGAALAADRRRTVALLKGAGLSGPDQLLGSTLDAISEAGLFGRGAVIVGTAAYLVSEALVGSLLPTPTLMTEDLDLASADLSLSAVPSQSMLSILQKADPSFEGTMQLDPRRPPSRFRNANRYIVDVVTPTRRRTDENPMPMTNLAAGAAPLAYLGWLIDNPIGTVALWGSGVPVTVPQPARFAVHKLILAQKRLQATRYKRTKDLAQARALIEALQYNDPYALEDAVEDARARGKRGWAEPIARSLKEIGLNL